MTIARVYHNRHDTVHFELLFDGFLKMVLSVTGQPLRFSRFTPGGNLKTMSTDMETAQVLGIAQSLLKSLQDDPSFFIDGVVVLMSAKTFASYFIRLCLTHVKRCASSLGLAVISSLIWTSRAILDFQKLITHEEWLRLLEFPHLRSREELDEYVAWVRSLNQPPITREYMCRPFAVKTFISTRMA